MRYFVLGDAAPAGTISARRSTAGTKGRRRPHRRELRLEAMEPRQLPAGVAFAHSVNVAVIGDPFTNDGSIDIEPVNNGGHLPLGGGGFAAFHFTHLAPADVNAAALAPYDTVLLNVASNAMANDTANLS